MPLSFTFFLYHLSSLASKVRCYFLLEVNIYSAYRYPLELRKEKSTKHKVLAVLAFWIVFLYLLKLLFRVTILLMHTLLKLCYTCGLQLFSSFTICYKVTVRLPEISFPFVLLGLIISSSPTKLGRTAGGADKNYNASNSYTEPILKTCALTSQRGL